MRYSIPDNSQLILQRRSATSRSLAFELIFALPVQPCISPFFVTPQYGYFIASCTVAA